MKHISDIAHALEARALLENEGYDEEYIDWALDAYDELMNHIGFEDTRTDDRYVVKFHDIFYYTPVELANTDEFNTLFDAFCEDIHNLCEEEWSELDIDIDNLLTRYNVGHYKAFRIQLGCITKETNLLELAKQYADEYADEARQMIKNQMHVIRTLKHIEDNYVEWWIQDLRVNKHLTDAQAEEMKDAYNKDHPNNQIK